MSRPIPLENVPSPTERLQLLADVARFIARRLQQEPIIAMSIDTAVLLMPAIARGEKVRISNRMRLMSCMKRYNKPLYDRCQAFIAVGNADCELSRLNRLDEYERFLCSS